MSPWAITQKPDSDVNITCVVFLPSYHTFCVNRVHGDVGNSKIVVGCLMLSHRSSQLCFTKDIRNNNQRSTKTVFSLLWICFKWLFRSEEIKMFSILQKLKYLPKNNFKCVKTECFTYLSQTQGWEPLVLQSLCWWEMGFSVLLFITFPSWLNFTDFILLRLYCRAS